MIAPPLRATTPLDENANGPSYRACGNSSPETSVPLKSKRKKNNRLPDRGDIAPYCLEIHASAMDVQEHLQAFIRKQHWPISNEDVNDYLWSFELALGNEELMKYGMPDPPAERVNWQGGKAVILVRSIDVADGFTRSTISVQLTGFGESEDTFAMHRSTWTFVSSGKLESALIEELRSHFRSGR